MRKVSPYQSPKMRGAQQEPLYSQGHQEGEVGRGRRDHVRQEGRAGGENEKESLRRQSQVPRVQLQDELFVLSMMCLLEPRGQQSPETNRVCSSSASRSHRGRRYLYMHVRASKHMSTCVCICMCVLSLHLETEADVYCLTLCIVQLPRTCLSPALTRGSTRHSSFNLCHHHPFGSPNHRVGVLIVLGPIL